MPSCVAPPAARSAAVALPCRILATSVRLVVVGLGTRHTLASYLSMQPAPATTASAGHLPTGPLGGPAAAPPCTAASVSTTAIANPFRNDIISVSLLLPGEGPSAGPRGPATAAQPSHSSRYDAGLAVCIARCSAGPR